MAFTDTPDSIYALLTDFGRHNLARSALGEISIQIRGFSVGRSGYLDSNPVKISPLDTSLTDLESHVFPSELGPVTTLSSITGSSTSATVIDGTSVVAIGQKIALSQPNQITSFSFSIQKNGSPQGQLVLKMVKDDAGFPSTDPADLILLRAYDCASLPNGTQTLTVDALGTAINSDFHIIVQPDETYTSTYVSGNDISVVYETSGSQVGEVYDGSVWSSAAEYFQSQVQGQLIGAPTQKAFESLEFPTPKTIVVNCRLSPQEAISALGEIGLWAEIVNSTVSPAEIGTKFMFAVGHFPLQVKTRRQASVYRFITQF